MVYAENAGKIFSPIIVIITIYIFILFIINYYLSILIIKSLTDKKLNNNLLNL